MPQMKSNSPNFSMQYIGTVLAIDIINREVVVFIPNLMPALPGEKISEGSVQTMSRRTVSGYSDYRPAVTIRNGITAKAWNTNSKMPTVGSKVDIIFFNANPKRPFWLSFFNSNGDVDYIESEKYSKLFNLRINNKDIKVAEDDSVEIEINSDRSILSLDGKTKKVKLDFDREIEISSSLPTNLIPGKMWFNTNDNNLFIYKDNMLLKMPDELEIRKIYDYLRNFTSEAVYIPDPLLVDFSKLKIGDIVSKRNEVILYRKGDLFSDKGFFYLNGKNIFLENGNETTDFRIVKENLDGNKYLARMDGFSDWDGSFSVTPPNTISFNDKKIALANVRITSMNPIISTSNLRTVYQVTNQNLEPISSEFFFTNLNSKFQVNLLSYIYQDSDSDGNPTKEMIVELAELSNKNDAFNLPLNNALTTSLYFTSNNIMIAPTFVTSFIGREKLVYDKNITEENRMSTLMKKVADLEIEINKLKNKS